MNTASTPALLVAILLASTPAVSGCSGHCSGGGGQTVYPDSLRIGGHVTYRSPSGDVTTDLAVAIEPHYADPIYDGERIVLDWQLEGPMTFELSLQGPSEVGTFAAPDLSARLCACEQGFLQGPDEARECFLDGNVTPAWCEDLEGEATIRTLTRDCIGSGAMTECAEQVDLDLTIEEPDGGRFSGTIAIRWFESIQDRGCYDGPSIDMS